MKKAVLGLAIVLPLMSGGAFAGTLMFNGQISADTCKVSVDDGKSSNIFLPVVSSSQLNETGKVAGRTDFTFTLTDCPADGNVKVLFNPGPGSTNDSGRLINASAASNAAQNLTLQVLDNDSPISVSDESEQKNSGYVEVIDGMAQLSYSVEYYAEGAVTVGPISSFISYNVVYE